MAARKKSHSRQKLTARAAASPDESFEVPELDPLPLPAPPTEPAPPPQEFFTTKIPPIVFQEKSDPENLSRLRDLHNRLTTKVKSKFLDWREMIAAPLAEGNIEGMKQAGVIPAEYKVLQLSQEADSEAIQFQAAQLILAQNGHGAVQKTDIRVDYEQLPTDQLRAIVQSKLAALAKLIPNFDVKTLIPEKTQVIEAEVASA